jgi:hypothetical protein
MKKLSVVFMLGVLLQACSSDGHRKVESEAVVSYTNDLFNEFEETGTSLVTILTEDFREYTVEQGDTLMLISYKLFGDWRLWRHFEEWNPDITRRAHQLKSGESLRYDFSFIVDRHTPRGLPYLVVEGDTLGKISHNVYNDHGERWQAIFENNRYQIYDPNLIFAGFTLYYIPLEEIHLSSNR